MKENWRLGEFNVTYLARSFLDYRVPVYQALDSLTGGRLHVVYSTLWTPKRVQGKLAGALGERAIALGGEKYVGQRNASEEMANAAITITYQPGLVSAIARTRPDVLISDGFFKWTPAAIIYRITRRVPLVVCYERTFHTERNAQWYRLMYRRIALRFVDSVCCNGRLSASYTCWMGVPPCRITTGHMAADTEGLRNRADAVTPDEREALRKSAGMQGTVFLYVGQLIRRKGVRELLLGWSLLEQRVPPGSVTLAIIGTGAEAATLRSLAAERNLRSVRFLGSVDYDRIASYYAAADVFVMPTLEDNWSLVVPEAMACGLPILCSKYNGCWPELVHSEGNGWLFDPLAGNDVVRVLELALKNKARLPEMGGHSRVVVSDHSPQSAARSILRACEIAINGRRGEGREVNLDGRQGDR